MYAVEHELELLSESIENQVMYLTAMQHFLEFDMRTISLFDGMDLDERLRYYELKEAIEEIQHKIAMLRIRKPATRFTKIDETDADLDR